jgi:hypothetical protein
MHTCSRMNPPKMKVVIVSTNTVMYATEAAVP